MKEGGDLYINDNFGDNVLTTKFTIDLKDQGGEIRQQIYEELVRERKFTQIQNQRAEARKTVLKKRCNYIIN